MKKHTEYANIRCAETIEDVLELAEELEQVPSIELAELASAIRVLAEREIIKNENDGKVTLRRGDATSH